MFQAEGIARAKALEIRKSLVCSRNRKHVSISGLQPAWEVGGVQIMQSSAGFGKELGFYFKFPMLTTRLGKAKQGHTVRKQQRETLVGPMWPLYNWSPNSC